MGAREGKPESEGGPSFRVHEEKLQIVALLESILTRSSTILPRLGTVVGAESVKICEQRIYSACTRLSTLGYVQHDQVWYSGTLDYTW